GIRDFHVTGVRRVLFRSCRGRGTCGFAKAESKEQANTQIINNKNSTITLIIDRSKITKEEEYKIVGQYLTTTSKVNELTFAMEEIGRASCRERGKNVKEA